MKIIVQKFGGTTIETPEKIKIVAKHLAKKKDEGFDIIAVVSAMGKDTDKLHQLAYSISKTPDPRELDMLISIGERKSIALLSMALKDLGYKAISFTGSQAAIITDNNFNNARILEIGAKRVKNALRKDKIVIVAGYQGVSKFEKEITTLGRGGTDTTAVAIAYSLKAEYCEIFTDVPGVLTVDPKYVDKPKLLKRINYSQMMEMSFLGSEVLEPRSVEIASKHNIKLKVNSLSHKTNGTSIEKIDSLEKVVIIGIAVDNDIFSIEFTTNQNFLADLLDELSKNNIIFRNFYNVNNNSYKIIFHNKDSNLFQTIVKTFNINDYKIYRSYSSISVIGNGCGNSIEIMKKIIGTLKSMNIKPISIDTSEIKISILIDKKYRDKFIKELSDIFNLND